MPRSIWNVLVHVMKETVDAIRPVLRRLDEGAGVDFILGHNPYDRPSEKLAERSLEIIERNELRLLEALPQTVAKTVDGQSADESLIEQKPQRAWCDRGEEEAAWQRLSGADASDEEAMAEALSGLRAAFAGFGFAAVLRLSKTLLDHRAEGPHAAEVHRLAALSTHAMSPSKRRDAVFDDMVETHLCDALTVETDSLGRAVLLYRLSILRSNARRDGEGAYRLSTDSLQEAAQLKADVAPYYAAWAHNSRGLACFRLRRAKEALGECSEALRLLHDCEPDLAIPEAEIAVTRYYILENLIRMAFLIGDDESAAEYLRQHEACLSQIPPTKRADRTRSLQLWQAMNRSTIHLEQARRMFATSLAGAQDELDVSLVAVFAHFLGDCLYRLGDARTACHHFVTAHRARQSLQENDIARELHGELNCAVAAQRAGYYEQVERHIRRIFHHATEHGIETDSFEGELLPVLAIAAADRGDRDTAERHFRNAEAIAAESDDPVLCYRTLRWLGHAYLQAKRTAEAQRAFLGCVAIVNEAGSLPPAAEYLPVLVGLLEAGTRDPVLIEQALRAACEALGDPSAWWELPRLLSHLVEMTKTGACNLPEPETQAFTWLERILQCARQRHDCRTLAEQLYGRLHQLHRSGSSPPMSETVS